MTPSMAVELGLPFEGTGRATLGDGSETTFPYYGVAALWDGRTRYVEADADTTPLVGMRLLNGHSLYVESRGRWARRHRAQGYRLNSTSKVVLPTVKLGPAEGIRTARRGEALTPSTPVRQAKRPDSSLRSGTRLRLPCESAAEGQELRTAVCDRRAVMPLCVHWRPNSVDPLLIHDEGIQGLRGGASLQRCYRNPFGHLLRGGYDPDFSPPIRVRLIDSVAVLTENHLRQAR